MAETPYVFGVAYPSVREPTFIVFACLIRGHIGEKSAGVASVFEKRTALMISTLLGRAHRSRYTSNDLDQVKARAWLDVPSDTLSARAVGDGFAVFVRHDVVEEELAVLPTEQDAITLCDALKSAKRIRL